MQIDCTLPPSLVLMQVNGMRGTDQLRAAADIVDQIAQMTVPEHFVEPYCTLVSNILMSVQTRMIAATSSFQQQRSTPQDRLRCL